MFRVSKRRLRCDVAALAVGVLALWLGVGLSLAEAGVFSGTIKSVDKDGTVTVEFASNPQRQFHVGKETEIKLDGETITHEQLKPGQKVSIFTRDETIRLMVVRSETADNSGTGTSAGNQQSPPRRPDGPGRGPRRGGRRSRPASDFTIGQAGAPDAGTATFDANAGPIETVQLARADDWPQFRGPARDNVSRSTGLLTAWPADGPPLAWTTPGLGEGYSSVAVANGKVYTMGTQDGREFVFAMDVETGRALWSAPTGGPLFRDGAGNGPRSTPTVDGDHLYALGAAGDLVAVNVENGEVRWSKNVLRDFRASNIGWGICESVLIDGASLISTPGGRGATMVALDKRNGETLWTATAPGDPRASYASPIVAEVDGVRQYVAFVSSGVIGVRADDGTFLWGDSNASNGNANCATPVFYKDHVFYASGYGTGGALLALESQGKQTKSQPVYRTSDMKNHHGGMVLVDGYLYGSNDPGVLTCLELGTGKVAWQNRSVGKGSIAYADGHIYLRSEGGPVALVEATPEAYREKARFEQPKRSSRPAWSHPVIANGKLFLRDMDLMLCFNLTPADRSAPQ